MEDQTIDNAVAEEVVEPQSTETTEVKETPSEVVESESVQTEVASVTEEVKQSPEENAKFAEVRKKAEAEASVKAVDKFISDKYGESHGIHTVAEYDAIMDKQKADDAIKRIADEENVSEDVAKRLFEGDELKVKTKEEKETIAAKEKEDQYMIEFVKKYPDVKELSQEVSDKFGEGNMSLVDAYLSINAEVEVKELKEKLSKYENQEAIQNKNTENAGASTGSVTGNGSTDNLFTRDQVKGMSRDEVNKNYSKIIESQKQWK